LDENNHIIFYVPAVDLFAVPENNRKIEDLEAMGLAADFPENNPDLFQPTYSRE